MGYTLPPPPPSSDALIAGWLFELYKRNGSLVSDTTSTGQLTGDVTAPSTAFDGGDLVLDTTVALPNVTIIDGGAAGTDYTAQAQGPYGVVSGVEIEGDGISLTGAVTKINFSGFSTTEPATDEIKVAFGVAGVDSAYCPGYPYTFISTTSWKVASADASSVFRVGRRCYFTDGATTHYGTILTTTFAGGDTTMTMSMDTGALTNTVSEVCLTTSATAWGAILADPFSGTKISDICTGVIGATQWWFAVGNGGKVATSSDSGLNWTLRTTVTTVNLTSCTYDDENETFWGGGVDGVLVSTTDGTTIVEDATTIAALASGGDGDIVGFTYSKADDSLFLMYEETATPGHAGCSSVDQGATWTQRATLGIMIRSKCLFSNKLAGAPESGAALFGLTESSTSAWSVSSAIAGSWTQTDITVGPTTAGVGLYDGSQTVRMYGQADGDIIGKLGWTGDDTNTFTQPIRDFAYSTAHARLVCVGDNAELGYLEGADGIADKVDAWTAVSSGFAPTADITAVDWNAVDAMYIAVANNGQICRSSSGLGDTTAVPTAFALIGDDPFGGASINAIVAGAIGATIYWQAVAGAGVIYYSTDKGVTWTVATSGTSTAITNIAYDVTNEHFVYGCGDGTFGYSSNGTTWTADSTTIAAKGQGGSSSILALVWDVVGGAWWFNVAAATNADTYSVPDITTPVFTAADTNSLVIPVQRAQYGAFNGFRMFFHTTTEDIYGYQGATDTTDSVMYAAAAGSIITAHHSEAASGAQTWDGVTGLNNGDIHVHDNARFAFSPDVLSGAVRAVMYSSVDSRWVVVGDSGQLARCEVADLYQDNSWINTPNPFTANITDIWYDPTDAVWVAVGSNGQIGRSTDGIS